MSAIAPSLEAVLEAPEVNLCVEPMDTASLAAITAREAWENLVLPLRSDAGTLVLATAAETLSSAAEFVRARIAVPYRFVISEIRPLEQFIAERYGFEGVDCDDTRVDMPD